MTIEAKVILDSIAPNGARLTTFELTYPRLMHAELMTHRVFSRNAASSRAIPTPKKIERIRKDCAKPSEWGVNQKGMQASGPLAPEDAERAEKVWNRAKDHALAAAEALCGLRCWDCYLSDYQECLRFEGHPRLLDLHKQVANRILEPFDHITTVVSTTKLSNHWKLRLETDPVTGRPMPDPTYFELATKWKAAFGASVPKNLEVGQWHLPYVTEDDAKEVHDFLESVEPGCTDRDADSVLKKKILMLLKKVSVGRVARTSYMRQGQGDVAANVELHDRLAASGHWSPFEAVATPIDGIGFSTFEAAGDCCLCGESYAGSDRCAILHLPMRHNNVADLVCGPGGHRVCQKCALGHVTSGNFVGWHQYRKDFPNEAGGD